MGLLLTVEGDFVDRTEGNNAVLERKERMVFAQSYVFARYHAGAALTHDDIAGLGNLARIELNAKVFCLRIG